MQTEKARGRFVETTEPFNLVPLISVLNCVTCVCVAVCFHEE